MKYYYQPLLYITLVLLSCGILYGQGEPAGKVQGAYLGVPWKSPFPVIEHSFPGVEFVEEDNFHVTLFRVATTEKDVKRLEFKLFENQLISAILYYRGAIDKLISEQYLQGLVTGLGPLQEKRKTTSNTLAGVATVEIYEYQDVLVLFRYYPPGQKEGFVEKQNSIVIIYKPAFDKMLYYRKHSDGDMEDIEDYDYIDF